MHPLHKEILEKIKEFAKTPSRSSQRQDYHGTQHHHYLISIPIMNQLAKDWAKHHKNISVKDLLGLLNSLSRANSYEEKNLVGKIIGQLNIQRSEIEPKYLDRWLEQLEGWAEIDSLCQNKFSERDLLNHWQDWEKTLKKFSTDKYVSKRRASLVLLTGPVTHSSDTRLSSIAFENIEKLTHEKNILITKAISWLLRSLVKYHKEKVEGYIEKNKDTLPKIAVRETMMKLTTGKKNKSRVK